jgi:hypothetical protein
MAQVQINITKKADRKVKIYMAENEISDKRVAINKIIEDM